jgi:hypothetical protein
MLQKASHNGVSKEIGEDDKMKNSPTVFPMALAAITAAVCFNLPWSAAQAQTPYATNVVTTPPPATGVNPAAPLSYGVQEVIKMHQAGVTKDVILSFIHNTSLPYHLGKEGVISLQNLGLPQEIIQAINQRDAQLQQQHSQPTPVQTQPAPAPTANSYEAGTVQPPVTVATPSTPPPTITTDESYSYPPYDSAYYGPDYYYGGPVIIGGWGWGRGWGWNHGGGYGGVHGLPGGFHSGGGGGFHGGFGGGHGGGGGHR